MVLTGIPMSLATVLKRRCSSSLSLSVRSRSRSVTDQRISDVKRICNRYFGAMGRLMKNATSDPRIIPKNAPGTAMNAPPTAAPTHAATK